jgi:hypothetical protein
VEDEGEPFEVGFQERASNHLKLLRLRVVVVNVGVKALRKYLGQVRIRETNESESSMTRRNSENCHRNQKRFYLLGQACRGLSTGQAVTGV